MTSRRFFEKHRLQLRIFDKFYHEIFKYDPPTRNHHNKAMYCMMTDDHIYTLNQNVKRLEQKQDADCEEIKPLTISNDYMIKEDADAREAKMIDTIDDILTVAKTVEQPSEKNELKIVSLVHRQDNLTSLLLSLIHI